MWERKGELLDEGHGTWEEGHENNVRW